jgi:succinyl-diaminopimelate desuccinylase
MLTPDETRLLSFIDDDQLIRWVQELTRINSVWRPEQGLGEEQAARWVEARCRELGLETNFEVVVPGRPNVVAVHRGAGAGKVLLFEGHTDVVTEGDPALWRDPPFSAVIRDGRIYGRGANDMKAGLVCALAALAAVARSGLRLSGDVVLAALCDEEGSMLGVKHLVDSGQADGVSAAIICEPEENHICVAQKGVMWVRAAIHGVMAHGAMPLTGVNPVQPMACFLAAMHDLEAQEIARFGQYEFLGQPSITPTIVLAPARSTGEPQNNVTPGSAEAVLDFRITPDQDPAGLAFQTRQLLNAAVAVDPRLSAELEVLEIRPPTSTNRAEPVVAALASAFTDLTGAEPTYGGVPGTTDGTILHERQGIPIVTCGPGDIHIPHHVDEWVSLDEIRQAARLYALAAARYLGVSPALPPSGQLASQGAAPAPPALGQPAGQGDNI